MSKSATSWKDMSTAERKAVLVGWAAIIIVAGWFFWPSREEPPAEAPAVTESQIAGNQAPVFLEGGPNALTAAAKLMSDLDNAMLDGPDVILRGDLSALGAHSRRLGDLAASAKAQFGSTIYNRLGRCGIASGNARSWWNAQLAARKDGTEPVPGAIKDFLNQYQENKEICLEAAQAETEG